MAMQPFYLKNIFLFRPIYFIFFKKYLYSMFQLEMNYNDNTLIYIQNCELLNL